MQPKLTDLWSDDLVRRLLSGGAAAAVIKIASAGAAYAMFVVLARLLPAEQYGRFAFAISLAIPLSLVFSLGLPVAALRFWPQHNGKAESGLGRSFIARAIAAVCIGSIVCSSLFFAGASLVTRNDTSFGTDYWAVVALLIALMSLAEFAQAALRADGVIVLSLAPRDIGWQILVISASVAAYGLTKNFGAELALWIATVSLALVTFPQVAMLLRRLKIRRADYFGPTQMAMWLSATWPMWGASVLVGMIQQFDVVLLGMFVGPEQTGPYFAALRTATLMTLVLFAANMVAAPLISQYYHSADFPRLRRMNRLLVIGITAPTLLGFGLLVAFGRPLLAVFDPHYVDAYWQLVILAAGFSISALAGPVNYFLQMVGLERQNLKIQATVYGAVVVAQCLLIGRFGALGVAVPNMVGAGIAAFWAVSLLRRRVEIDTSIFGLIWPPRPVPVTGQFAVGH